MTTQDRIDQATANLLTAANELTALLDKLPPRTCPRCDGRGRIHEAPIHRDLGRVHFWGACPDCAGSGALPYSHSDLDILLHSNPRTRCAACAGQTGTYDGRGQWWPCSPCGETGYREGVIE
jgi:hypothetical protein